jgi:hypothetical protein
LAAKLFAVGAKDIEVIAAVSDHKPAVKVA